MLLVGVLFAASACSKEEEPTPDVHNHEYAAEWTSTADGHYKKCTCHPGEGEKLIKHFDNNDDDKCDACEYDMSLETEPVDPVDPVGPVLYTVSVLDTDGTPIAGANVVFTDFAGNSYEQKTDKYGRAYAEIPKADFNLVQVALVSASSEYSNLDTAPKTYADGQTELTVTNAAERLVAYTFTVLDTDGFGIVGARVMICTGDDCRTGMTDENGSYTVYISRVKAESEGVKAKIDTLPQGYANPDGADVPYDYTDYPEGEYVLTATAAYVSSYTVSATDLFGRTFEGVTVKLYNSENNLVSEKLTNENGVAEFFVTAGEYRVEAKHYNAGYVLTNGDSARLTPESSSLALSFVKVAADEFIPHTVTGVNPDGSVAETVTFFIFSLDGESYGTFGFNSQFWGQANLIDGDYVISARSGDYYAIAYIYADGATDIVLNFSDVPAGSEENPILAFDLLREDRAFTATESLYAFLPSVHGKVVTVPGDDFILTVDGIDQPADPDTGLVTFTFTAGSSFDESGIFKLTAKADVTESIGIAHPGSEHTPYEYDADELEELSITLDFLAGETKYFEFFGDVGKVLTVEGEGITVVIGGIEGAKSPIDPGWAYFNITSAVAGSVTVNITYKEELADYTASVSYGDAPTEGIKVELYSTLFGADELVAELITDSEGKVVFEDIPVKNGYVLVISSDIYNDVRAEILGTEEPTLIYLSHRPNGTEEFPYAVELGENSFTLSPLGIAYFDLMIRGNATYTLTAPLTAATLDVLVLDGEQFITLSLDGEHSFDAYGITVDGEGVYTFGENGIYKLLFRSTSEEEQSVSFTYLSNAKTRENAEVVAEAGTVTVKIENGESAYYRLELEGHYTVTAPTGAGVVKISVTEQGEITENVDGLSFTVTLSADDEVYFRITSPVDGEFDVEVSDVGIQLPIIPE